MVKYARMMMLSVLCVVCSTAGAAELEKVKALMKIGDYAAAVSQLGSAVQADPTHVEARLLMARAFAESPAQLSMPGNVAVGQNNLDRAAYQLGIVLQLGDKGQAAVFELIRPGNDKLTPLAIRVVGQRRVAAAAAPLTKMLEHPDTPQEQAQSLIWALAALRTEDAAKAVLKHYNQQKDANERRRLAHQVVDALDEAGRAKLAESTEDPLLLNRLVQIGGAEAEAVQLALLKRADLDEKLRLQALRRLAVAHRAEKAKLAGLMRGFVKDPSEAVRTGAILELAKAEPETSGKLLIDLLASKKRDSVQEAFRALRELPVAAKVETLLKLLQAKNDPERYQDWPLVRRDDVYGELIRSDIDEKTLLRVVQLMLQPDPSQPKERGGRAVKIPWMKREQFAVVLPMLAKHEDVTVRAQVFQYLISQAHEEAIPLALEAVRDPDKSVSTAAGRALLMFERRGKIPAEKLVPVIECKDTWVQQSVIRLLTQKAAETAAEPMLALLKDKERAAPVMAELAGYFKEHPSEDAAAAFFAAIILEKPPAPVDTLAAALAKCVPNKADTAKDMAMALKHKSSAVRGNAARALMALGEAVILPELEEAARKATGHERRIIDFAIKDLTKKNP
jgi:HEAT repeat protein